MPYSLIDTHTHLYLDDFNNDLSVIINNCQKNGIHKLLLPNIDSTTIEAVNKLCSHYNYKLNDFDVFELNEAFAAQSLACIRSLKIPEEKVNINDKVGFRENSFFR